MWFTPDDFRNDWYGYAKNQVSHGLLGMASAWVVAAAGFWYYEEFPDKTYAWLLVAFLYSAYELLWQRWNGLDTIEDILFWVVYGAGGALLVFSEVEPGNPVLQMHIAGPAYVGIFAITHLAIGTAYRVVLQVVRK